MKIVCMDCQNESYSDLESLKANGRVVCAQCAENSHSHSDKEVEVSRTLPLNEGIEAQASTLDESSAMSETSVQDEEVLELSDAVFISDDAGHVSDNNVILFPELETQPARLEEEGHPDQTADSLLKAVSSLPESASERLSQVVDFTYELPEQVDDSRRDPQLSEALPVNEVERVKGMRLMAFPASKQIVLTVACVLSIILMQTLFASSSQVSIKAESANQPGSPKPVSPAVTKVEPQEVKEVSSPAQVSQNNPTPAPTSAPAVEEKPVAAPPGTEQTVEKPKGLYTLQVGSHQGAAEANAQAGKYRAAGYEPRIISAEIPKRGTWYRVQLGDFSTREEANSFGATLRAKGLADNFIVSGQ